jgi:hypothetical protein
MRCKVFEIRSEDGSDVAAKLEAEIGRFLNNSTVKDIVSSHVQALDIGGPSQAEILVLATVFYR